MKINSLALMLLLSLPAINQIRCQEPTVIKRLSAPVEFDGIPFENILTHSGYENHIIHLLQECNCSRRTHFLHVLNQ